MSVDTVARVAITLAADPERLEKYRKSTEGRIEMVGALNPESWPLTPNEKRFLELGDFNLIFQYLDENRGERGINQTRTDNNPPPPPPS